MSKGKSGIEVWLPENVIKAVKGATVENMEQACEVVAEDMRRRAPERTGKLKEAIDYEVITDESGNIEGRIGIRHGFARTHVARFLEFGTSKMAAQPFMRPALLNNLRRIEQILKGKK